MAKIYVLTRGHNDHNQHGDYFVAAFKQHPAVEQLLEFTKEEVGDGYSNVADLLKFLLHLQRGGGRINDEQVWFCLTQTDLN